MPCFKLGIRFGRADMVKRFLRSGRTGFYLALAREGEVTIGDTVTLIARHDLAISVAAIVKLSWSLWSYQWTPDEEGETGMVVRATDGEGKLQISKYRDQVPDGATGLHRVRAIVQKA